MRHNLDHLTDDAEGECEEVSERESLDEHYFQLYRQKLAGHYGKLIKTFERCEEQILADANSEGEKRLCLDIPHIIKMSLHVLRREIEQMREQKPLTEDVLLKVRIAANRANWIFAKTYIDKFPHYYCVRDYMVKDGTGLKGFDMLTLANAIWDHGYSAEFMGKERLYLEFDGYKYWSMDPSPASTNLINRVPLLKCDLDAMVKRERALL